ncbi:hypothetical protein XNRR2_00235b [Streptomyces albidoflavus]|nr:MULTISPECIES: hypothetical protein [Actinomycetes]ASV47139.1 acyl-CoA dehydrogenase [uncultured bacterium]QLP92967.1 hypothetical protein XNRR2_00235a [Streptomyces albidoflavus]QLP93242.1 hypothetical protein XNRR2_00235b [Streptomyces albidoflavus]
MERALQRRKNGTWVVRKNPPFVIFDEVMGDYCALPQDDDGEPVTLEWRSRSAAYDWLAHCLQTWQMWERTGRAADVPKAWRGFPVPEQSPWVGYTTPLYGPY